MILLDTSSTLFISLQAEPSSAEGALFASYVDIAEDGSTYAPGAIRTQTNGTVPVEWVSSPAAGRYRQAKYLSYYNADTVAATVVVAVGTTPLLKMEVAPGRRLEFDGAKFVDNTPGGSSGVSGPAAAVSDALAIFDGVTGQVLKDSTRTIASLRAPVVQTLASDSTVTPTFADDLVQVTALAANVTLANPTGIQIAGLGVVVRIRDNGTARAISYGSQYRAIGVSLPTTTVVGKTLYLAMIFNSTDTRWDVVAVGQEA